MAFTTYSQMSLVQELLDALGMKGVLVQRLVIDISVDDVVKCYAVTLPPAAMLNPLVKLVSAVSVSEKGEITTAPLPFTQSAVMLANAVLAGDIDAARPLADEIIAECGGK